MGGKTADDVELGERVRAWVRKEREDRGITQNAMAERLGYSSGTFSRYMTATRGPPIGFVLRVRRRLGVDPKLLLEEDPPARFFQQDGNEPRRRRSVSQ